MSKTRMSDLSAPVRRIVIWFTQIAIFSVSLPLALLILWDLHLPEDVFRRLFIAVPLWILVKAVVFRLFRLDRGWWQYVTSPDLVWLCAGNALATALCFVAQILLHRPAMQFSVYLLDSMVCLLLTGGARLGARLLADMQAHVTRSAGTPKKSTLIYGAGEAGLMLLREIRRNGGLPYRVHGFLDDRQDKWGLRIGGASVLGGGDRLVEIARRHAIDMVLIAIPSASGPQMGRILERCHEAGLECKTVPSMAEMIAGRALAGQIREVAVNDLLGRSPIQLAEDAIRDAIQGRVVLVTGAGGSIGSELCRQIARFNPEAIVGFDCAESALFEVDLEIRAAHPNVRFYPEIGNIQNRHRVDAVFSRYLPHAVFHAAAYKHVPLMEMHVFEAVENNVLGTYNVACAASDFGVKDFVLISSDKAVAPTSMMGATKRLTELMILDLQKRSTKYVSVRFGNVLGSNGSVIPIFKKQIAKGGPVTVTHPEMRRFFMTIPEACQLVLQAAVIAEGGQICVLDMDEPVKIVDLARKLILLSGLKPERDIRIEFSGIRPGEKLTEELTSAKENTIPSSHSKIRIFVGHSSRKEHVLNSMELFRDICHRRDLAQLVTLMKDLLEDYTPSAELLERAEESADTLETASLGQHRLLAQGGNFHLAAVQTRHDGSRRRVKEWDSLP